MVGRSGATGLRFKDVMASARMRPALMCGRSEIADDMVMSTCPPIKSGTVFAEPLYGTWTNSIPVLSRKSSMVRCEELPTPVEAYVTWPGFAFMSATSSFTVFGGRVSRTARDRKSTRLNSSHVRISYAVFCLKKKKHSGISRALHAGEHRAP